MNVTELAEMDKLIGYMLDNTQAPLMHGIYDLSETESLPSAKDLIKLKSGSHPRVGWLIFIGINNKIMKFFVSVAAQSFNIRLRFMDTIEEALTFLQDVDSTLPDLKGIDLVAAEARIHESAITLGKLPKAS